MPQRAPLEHGTVPCAQARIRGGSASTGRVAGTSQLNPCSVACAIDSKRLARTWCVAAALLYAICASWGVHCTMKCTCTELAGACDA